MNIITRAEWGARVPRSGGFPRTTWASRTGFVTHYSAASATQTVRSIQNYQMDSNGWRDIGYNFLVDYRGRVYEGAQGTWFAIGAHVANHNTANIGVCAIGTDAEITTAQMQSIRWLYDECNRRAGKTLGKRYHSGMSGANTSCPGNRLRSWVLNGMPVSQEEDDMASAEEIAEAVWGHRIASPGLNRTAVASDWLKGGYGAELAIATLKDGIVTGVLNGLGGTPVDDIVDALRATLDPTKLQALKEAL